MRRALLIVSICALAAVAVAVAGHALVVTQGIIYTPEGQPVSHSPLAFTATYLDAAGGILSLPACGLAFVLGIIAAARSQRQRWLAAIIIAAALAGAGLFVMAWILLSGNAPVAAVTPLALVPLITLLFSLRTFAGLNPPRRVGDEARGL